MLHDNDVGKAMEWYPKVNGEEEERANKYWVMYGNTNDLQSKRYACIVLRDLNSIEIPHVKSEILLDQNFSNTNTTKNHIFVK